MNSWRIGEHFCPTAVRKPIPVSHSSGVRSTSRANACKCRTAASMISLRRGFSVEDICSSTASVTVFSSIVRILALVYLKFSGTLLVETDDVSSRIAESGRDLRRIASDRLHDFASIGDDFAERCLDAVDHYVDHEAGSRSGRPSEDPGAADLPNAVVKSGPPIGALTDAPAEGFMVEIGGPRDVGSGDLDVANLAVGECGGHWSPFRKPSY